MKKTTKQALIWSGVALGAGGIAAGIAVPIIKDNNERSNINPTQLTGEETLWAGGPTINALMAKQEDKVDIKNSQLIQNTEHHLAFMLYEEEQKGSIELQKAYFEWEKHTIVKRLRDFHVNTLSIAAFTTDVHDVAGDYTKLTTAIQTKIDSITDADTKKIRQDSFNEMKKDWTDLLAKIDVIQNNKLDYAEARFDSKYPRIIKPLNTIREKIQANYNSTKEAMIKSAADRPSGEKEWFDSLSSRYHGATSDEEAVDGLVFNQIKNDAYKRFDYKMTSDFTYKQYQSGVFKSFLGDPGTASAPTTATDSLNNNGVAFKTTSPKEDDKVYFLASKSNVAEWINPVKSNKLFNLNHLTRINNAILGFKQDKTNVDAPWTVDKKMMTKLFSSFATWSGTTPTATKASDEWKEIFKAGKEDMTQRLVQNYSLTTDATGSHSGDLGISPALDNLKNMVPGFGLGVLSILHDLKVDATGATNDKVLRAPTFLATLMDALKTSFDTWATANGFSLTLPAATAVAIADYNKQVEDIINNQMTDADIKKVFGTVIREQFNKLKTEDGIPLAIKCSADAYMVISEEFGVHVIKVDDKITDFEASLKTDLQKAADKQDQSQITTHYDQLLKSNLSDNSKMKMLLDAKKNATTQEFELGNTDLLNKLFAIKDKLDRKDVATAAELGKEISTIINRRYEAEYLIRVGQAVKDATKTWLEKKINDGLILNTGETIKPEEIYNFAIEIGGGI